MRKIGNAQLSGFIKDLWIVVTEFGDSTHVDSTPVLL
jgi:hypothetical protein